ncbi:hypothetical protein Bbelb_034990 [Branchiostoma belcheri]|nr:hypothetical protein Bbelb_034990 [Branchiostoma belcheri]
MEDMKVQIHLIVSVKTTKLEQTRQETSKDEELQLLVETVTRGWPQKRNKIPPEIQGYRYWTIRDDISVEDGVLLNAGSRIIIPKSKSPEILQKIHEETIETLKEILPHCQDHTCWTLDFYQPLTD